MDNPIGSKVMGQPATGPWTPISPSEAARLFADVAVPWWIAGGVAIDLFVGARTRRHSDLDVMVLRRNQQAFRDALAHWELFGAHAGRLRRWRTKERLEAPVNQAWGRRSPDAGWGIELMFADAEGDQWVYRRCTDVRKPIDEIGFAADGVPVLAPEIVLLHKAKGTRPSDDHDFRVALPLMAGSGRAWLRAAITIAHPGHSWLVDL